MAMMNAFRAANFRPEAFAPGLTHHVFLIAIRGEPAPFILHRGNTLQPMQVVLTRADDVPPFAAMEAAIGPLPALPAPHRLMRAPNSSAALMPREITGEILRDASGKLYEKVGDYMRTVNQLFTGPRGEMIDLAPIPDVTAEPTANSAPTTEADGDASARPDAKHEERPLRELARKLVPEPGVWRLVRFADFIDVIAPQLADPRRLQPGHQLACYLQLYELTSTMPIVALEDAAVRELGASGKLLPLSYDLCRKFALSLPRPTFALAAERQAYSPGIVPAGARFMTLRVALDPTAEATAPLPQTRPTAVAATTSQDAIPTAAALIATPALKTSVPEDMSKPWDLRLSRDEALYDMTIATSRGAWQRLLDRLLNRVSRRDMKKWHALLSGKTSDQQLWAVKPPKGALVDARIQRWVEQTLQLGGYDVARMWVEWEIYWRRQGL
jgi:hypothetical protein